MVAVGILGDKIGVVSAWAEKDMVKQIPGSSWNNDEKVWTVPLSWAACKQLRGIFGTGLTMGDDLREWANAELKQRVTPALESRALLHPKVPDATVWSDEWAYGKLYDFQKAGMEFLVTARDALLTDEMGTGKTIQALSAMRYVLGGKQSALVICPNSMKRTWKREAEIWYPECTPYVVEGTAVARRKTLAQAQLDPSALVIINFESVRLHSRTAGFGSVALVRCKDCGGRGSDVQVSKCEVHPKELNAIDYRIVVVDEAHRIKDGQAKQTRAIWAAAHQLSVTRRWALTGTPVANNPADLWAIMHFVAPLEYPTKSKFVTRYCNTYFNSVGALEVGGLNPVTKPELFDFLNPRMRRTRKADVLKQLPPKVFTTRYVGMGNEQGKAYDQMSEGLVSRLPDGSLMVAGSHLAGLTRLIQFSSANMVSDGKDGYIMTDPSPKLDVMEEILEEMQGKQLVVAAVHKQLINLAAARLDKLGISYGMITGDVPQWERDINVQRFQKGEIQVMLLTMQAGGVGITLTAADTMLRLQCSWSLVDNTQVVDRIHRIGSEKHQQVTIIDVVTAGTVEIDQIEKVGGKYEMLKEVLQDA